MIQRFTFLILAFLLSVTIARSQDCKSIREQGWKLLEEARYDEALYTFETAIRCRDGFWHVALYGHACTLLRMNELKQAEKELLDLLKLKRKNDNKIWFSGVHLSLARIYARTSTKKEMEQYRLALKCDPNDALVLQTLGFALNREGDFMEALSYLDRAVEIDGGIAYAYSNRAHALVMTGNAEVALPDLQKSEALDPTNPYLYKHWGLYYLALNDTTKACEMFETAKAKGYKDFGLESDRYDVDILLRKHCQKQ